MATTLFTVHGPLEVPTESGKKYSYIPLNCPAFWKKHSQLKSLKGCYVFGFRAAKGFRPVYVGKTKNSFGNEVFTSHKIAQHYGPALADTGKGTPVMFLITASGGKGAPPKTMISDMETFLIQLGVAKNPDLSNIRNTAEAKWASRGFSEVDRETTLRRQRTFAR